MYDKASLALIPSGYKAGSTDNLYSVLPANGNGDFNATRGSTATRVNKDGLIETVATNVPRLDYTGNVDCPHLLLEPSRTNKNTYSEDFSSYLITPAGTVSITPNYGISPSGELNSTRVVLDSNSALYKFVAHSVNEEYSSLYVKGVSGETIKFGRGAVANAGEIFTLTGDWQRLEDTSTTGNQFSINTFSGVTARDIEIWGAQVEEGSHVTSYIPTLQNQAETRSADICNDSGTSAEFNDSEGVLFAEIAALANDGTNRRIAIPNTGFTALHRLEYFSTDNVINAVTYVSPSNQVVLSHTLPDSTKFVKIAYKYKTGDFALWVNGVEVGTSVSGNLPTGLTKLNFDNGSGSNDFYGKCKQLIVFNEALSDSELQTLTS